MTSFLPTLEGCVKFGSPVLSSQASADQNVVGTAIGHSYSIWSSSDFQQQNTLGRPGGGLHKSAISGGSISYTGHLVATYDKDKRIVIWDAKLRKALRVILSDQGLVFQVTFSPTEDSIYAAYESGRFLKHSIKTGHVDLQWSFNGSVKLLAPANQHSMMAVVTAAGEVNLCAVEPFRMLGAWAAASLRTELQQPSEAIVFQPDAAGGSVAGDFSVPTVAHWSSNDRYVVIGFEDGTTVCLDALPSFRDPEVVRRENEARNHSGDLMQVGVLRQKTNLPMEKSMAPNLVWTASHKSEVTALDYLDAIQAVVSGSKDCTVHFRDAASGSLRFQINLPLPVVAVCFLPANKGPGGAEEGNARARDGSTTARRSTTTTVYNYTQEKVETEAERRRRKRQIARLGIVVGERMVVFGIGRPPPQRKASRPGAVLGESPKDTLRQREDDDADDDDQDRDVSLLPPSAANRGLQIAKDNAKPTAQDLVKYLAHGMLSAESLLNAFAEVGKFDIGLLNINLERARVSADDVVRRLFQTSYKPLDVLGVLCSQYEVSQPLLRAIQLHNSVDALLRARGCAVVPEAERFKSSFIQLNSGDLVFKGGVRVTAPPPPPPPAAAAGGAGGDGGLEAAVAGSPARRPRQKRINSMPAQDSIRDMYSKVVRFKPTEQLRVVDELEQQDKYVPPAIAKKTAAAVDRKFPLFGVNSPARRTAVMKSAIPGQNVKVSRIHAEAADFNRSFIRPQGQLEKASGLGEVEAAAARQRAGDDDDGESPGPAASVATDTALVRSLFPIPAFGQTAKPSSSPEELLLLPEEIQEGDALEEAEIGGSTSGERGSGGSGSGGGGGGAKGERGQVAMGSFEIAADVLDSGQGGGSGTDNAAAQRDVGRAAFSVEAVRESLYPSGPGGGGAQDAFYYAPPPTAETVPGMDVSFMEDPVIKRLFEARQGNFMAGRVVRSSISEDKSNYVAIRRSLYQSKQRNKFRDNSGARIRRSSMSSVSEHERSQLGGDGGRIVARQITFTIEGESILNVEQGLMGNAVGEFSTSEKNDKYRPA